MQIYSIYCIQQKWPNTDCTDFYSLTQNITIMPTCLCNLNIIIFIALFSSLVYSSIFFFFQNDKNCNTLHRHANVKTKPTHLHLKCAIKRTVTVCTLSEYSEHSRLYVHSSMLVCHWSVQKSRKNSRRPRC